MIGSERIRYLSSIIQKPLHVGQGLKPFTFSPSSPWEQKESRTNNSRQLGTKMCGVHQQKRRLKQQKMGFDMV